MEVTVEEVLMHAYADRNKPPANRRVVRPNLWRVRVDGLHAGFIRRQGEGIYPGAKLMMHLRFPSEELQEIERKISEHFSQEIDARQPAEMQEMPGDEDASDLIDDLE